MFPLPDGPFCGFCLLAHAPLSLFFFCFACSIHLRVFWFLSDAHRFGSFRSWKIHHGVTENTGAFYLLRLLRASVVLLDFIDRLADRFDHARAEVSRVSARARRSQRGGSPSIGAAD